MSAFIQYQLINYIRSYRFIAPSTIFLAWVFITYAYKNVPVLSTYGTTSVALYIIMTWISMNVFSLEEESEKHILFMHLNGKHRYFWGKWIICFLFILLLTLVSHFYPILTKSFKEDLQLVHHFLSIYSHIILGLFGVFVGVLFSATRFSMTRHAWLSSALVIVITLGHNSIIKLLPFLEWMFIIFPPVTELLASINRGDQIVLDHGFWIGFSWSILYLICSIVVARVLFLKHEQ